MMAITNNEALPDEPASEPLEISDEVIALIGECANLSLRANESKPVIEKEFSEIVSNRHLIDLTFGSRDWMHKD